MKDFVGFRIKMQSFECLIIYIRTRLFLSFFKQTMAYHSQTIPHEIHDKYADETTVVALSPQTCACKVVMTKRNSDGSPSAT